MLLLHLNRFECNVSARKKQNFVDFPLEQLSLGELTTSKEGNPAFYNLYAVSNHYGTLNGGHYTSYCKPFQDVWYQCDDKIVTKLKAPVKTSAAYVLFYESVHIEI